MDLPIDIYAKIGSYLNKHDFLNMIHTCKYLSNNPDIINKWNYQKVSMTDDLLTLLKLALISRNHNMVDIIMKDNRFSNIIKNNNELFNLALKSKNLKFITKLLQEDTINPNYNLIIYNACYCNHRDIIKLLLTNKIGLSSFKDNIIEDCI